MKRTLAVVIAVLLAVLGAGSVMAYARSADQRALAGQRAVNVFVTTEVVPAGTTASQAVSAGLIEKTLIASKSLPAGALTSVDRAATTVATTDIAAGEIVLAQRFGAQVVASTALVVPKGQVAITIELKDPARVGPFLTPGSTVVVYDTFGARDSAKRPLTAHGAGLSQEKSDVNVTQVLLSAALVLAVGDTTQNANVASDEAKAKAKDQSAAPVPLALVTLAVSPVDAQRLVHATLTNELYLGLLGEGSDGGKATVEDRTLFGKP